ncbi:MAG: sulfatase-like hydrolase/transferase [Kiritimatiellae bacterium]|nr:sulfatase-like hydrolase/transferase [Kiritimatiellia bacterium]MDD5522753.1 sulfatase-like hydrolase/transferase [Kiritimatiellia bacterium]
MDSIHDKKAFSSNANLTRRQFARGTITAAIGVPLVFLPERQSRGAFAGERKPNFLIIMSDQQSPHVLGHAGDRVVRTPNLDRLAAGGVRFTATYCGSPLCVPSRMTFLTAQNCSKIEVWTNSCVLDSETSTFPGALAAAGYETVLAGRMHFDGPDQRHGFTRRTIGDVTQPHFPAKGKHPLLGSIPRQTTGQSKGAVETAGPGRTSYMAYDDAVTESACKFLAERDQQSTDKPFALVVGYVLPHCPYICPPELFNYYYSRVNVPQLPAGYLDKLHPAEREDRQRRGFDELNDEQVHIARAAYYGLVEYHDRLCGRVLDALKRTRIADNTVVVYTTDHGDMAGEHRLWTKSLFYEASAGVPMIWSWPGRFRAGTTVRRVTSLLDIGPTLLDLAGAPPIKKVAGRSLTGFFSGNGDVKGWLDETFAECCGTPAGRPSRMLREGPWKIILHHGCDKPQLFNLAEDPDEMNDRRDDPSCTAIRERLLNRVREGWDGERMAKKIAQSKERRQAAFEKARAHATPIPDYWDMPPDANIFPMK